MKTMLTPSVLTAQEYDFGHARDNPTTIADISARGIPVLEARVDYAWTVELFYKALYRFGFSLSGNESDAADLTQETYLVLLTKGHVIRDASKVKSWLFTTLYRQFLARRRHSTRFPEIPVESAEWELPTNTPTPSSGLDVSLVIAALQQLDEKDRAPLVMFYLQELSYKEMAEVLDVPIGTIMSRISRAKDILRRRLQDPSLPAVTCVNAAQCANSPRRVAAHA